MRYTRIKRAEEHPFGYESIKVDSNNNKETDALRRALMKGSGDKNLDKIPVYKAPSAVDSHILSNAIKGPTAASIDNKYTPVNSHEYGHAIDFDSPFTRTWTTLANISPALIPVKTLITEANANRKSWNALKNVYKDDPELLKQFGDLRTEMLTPAYKTYIASQVPQSVFGTAGTIMGNQYGNSHLGGTVGRVIGNAIGETLGASDMQRAAGEELINKINSKETKDKIDDLNKKIIAHAQSHNYYN